MWYTYNLIILKNKRLYTGYTGDLKQRFIDHNRKSGAAYTSKNAPFKLIHYEAFLTKEEAMAQEKFYKSGYGREVLKGKIKKSLNRLIGDPPEKQASLLMRQV